MGEIFLPDDSATSAFGARLAAVLRPGDLVLLDGDLGAGKTAVARAVIRALCNDPGMDVPSPTFALVQPYEANGAPILHADLYRLAEEREIDELGLFDRADAIVLVEWPGRAPSLAGMASVSIQISSPKSGGRNIAIAFSDRRPL
jgi:tRNA threonylcarbamoyl adenosine modification protein YjeE